MAVSSTHNGFRYDPSNSRVDIYYRGTRAASYTATTLAPVGTITAATGLTASTGALTVTAGNTIVTVGDVRLTAGNCRLGAVETFATTEPTSATVMKQGTAPSGAITTSSGMYCAGAAINKFIANGTLSAIGA